MKKDGPGEGTLGVAALGVGALAVACCAGLPLLAGFAGSLALGTVIGVGAGALSLIALVGFVVLRSRRRAACKAPVRVEHRDG